MIDNIMVLSVSALRVSVGSPSEKLDAQIGDVMNTADCNSIEVQLHIAYFQIEEWHVELCGIKFHACLMFEFSMNKSLRCLEGCSIGN
uniref:Ovule protein n=1 Tax=Parascaris univalens TaxID=6257 RepID=A0A915AS47_PARUN